MKLSKYLYIVFLLFSFSTFIVTSETRAAGLVFEDFNRFDDAPIPTLEDQAQPGETTSNGLSFQDFNAFNVADDTPPTQQTAPPVKRPGVSPIKCKYGYNSAKKRCKTKKEALGTGPKATPRDAVSCGNAPVCRTFNAALSKCGCQLSIKGTWRKGQGRSCHYSGRAIDVTEIICNGTKYNAYQPRFKTWFQCMTPSKKKRRNGTPYASTYVGNGLHSIFQEAHKRHSHGDRLSHYDHAHFSITCNGGRSW